MSAATPPQNPGGGATGLQSSTSVSLAGKTIDRYAIEALIGKGGMGEVYRALDGRLRRKVALKVLRPEQDRPDGVERLFREARAAASLTHPNTVTIHDLGESDGLFYIVMELVIGMPLLAYVGDDRVPLARKLAWCSDIARALSSAHKAGVVHRDVKPSNVMVSAEGVAKVLDFGLAKPVEPQSFDFRTQVGHVVGTVRYMSPEQLAGAEADARSDQYAFGVTAYELLSGRYPGGRPLGIPEPLDKLVPELHRAGAQVIERTMKPSPSDRFPSMDDVMVALDDVAKSRPVRVSLSPAVDGEAGTVRAGAGRAVDPSVAADTLRAPETSSDPDAPDAPGRAASENASAKPSAATMLDPEALARRQRAHARAHDAARTLLSQEAPSELIQALGRRSGTPHTAKNTAKMDAHGGIARSGPPTLASSLPRGASPPPVAPPPESPAKPPPGELAPHVAAPFRPPQSGPSASAPSTPPQRSTLPIVIVAVGVLAIATFAGTYFGMRARPSSAQDAPANVLPSAGPTSATSASSSSAKGREDDGVEATPPLATAVRPTATARTKSATETSKPLR